MKKDKFISSVKGGIIVSCQALPGEPLYCSEGGIMPLMAKAAEQGGAVGIRCNGLVDIVGIKNTVKLPIIGIIKRKYDGYGAYITPSMKEVDELVEKGVEVIAVDATDLTHPGDISSSEFISRIKEKYPDQLIMADCSSFSDAEKAYKAGADFVGTTMNGYTDNSISQFDSPNFQLVKEIVSKLPVPVIAEGRIHTPEDAVKMLEEGALCVVVGGAITRPMEITERFVHAINQSRLRSMR